MMRRRLASAAAATIAIPALGLGSNGAASARTISAGFYAERIVVLDCQGHPHVRPGRYTLACGDGKAAGPGRQRYTKLWLWRRGLHRGDTLVSPELTVSFASGHAGFGWKRDTSFGEASSRT